MQVAEAITSQLHGDGEIKYNGIGQRQCEGSERLQSLLQLSRLAQGGDEKVKVGSHHKATV